VNIVTLNFRKNKIPPFFTLFVTCGGDFMSDSLESNYGNYDAVVKFKDGKYHFYIRELNLIGTGDTLDSAYAEINRKREEVVKEFSESGHLDELPPPEGARPARVKGAGDTDLGGFAFKVLIAGLAVIVVLMFAVGQINRVFSSNVELLKAELNYISNTIPSKPGRVIEHELYKAVDHPISPERQKKIIESIRVIVKRLKPFVDEFKVLFADN